MARRGDYRTSAQKAGKSAGQRQKRMATDRKRRNSEANVYPTSVRSNIITQSRYNNDTLAVYGVYKEGTNKWVLTAMAIQRNVEKLVSDRQGAVKSETRDTVVVTPTGGVLDPKNGLKIDTFDTKSSALQEINATSSSRVDTGKYVVTLDDWNRTIGNHKIDRDKFRSFIQSRATVGVN
jgi:hypothetical protein